MIWGVGKKLQSDCYEVESELAQGNSGSTFLARDKKGNRVVIKRQRQQTSSDSRFGSKQGEQNQDFYEKALRLAVCQHTHVVHLENAFFDEGFACIVLEYIDGQNLWDWVKQKGAISEIEGLRYVQQIGLALRTIHEKGLLHRNLKPSQIMVRASDNQAVLIDAGISLDTLACASQNANGVFGDPFSPIEEYIHDAKRGEFTDVYFLASTLYFLLTAQLPIPAAARSANFGLVSPNLYSPTISDTVNQAILKGMEINPENRPCSVQQWLDLLDIGSQPMIKSQAAMVQTIYPLGIDTSQNLTNIYPTATVRSIYLKPSDENIKVDYELLQKYLESGDLRAANQETKGIMLRLVGREKQGWFDRISINNMSENDLYTINLLWIKYSNGRFGFSMQKCIWEDVGGSVNPSYQVLCEFGDRVGWRINNQWLSPSQINFSPNALNGHLPDLDVEVIGWIATRMMTSDVLL